MGELWQRLVTSEDGRNGLEPTHLINYRKGSVRGIDRFLDGTAVAREARCECRASSDELVPIIEASSARGTARTHKCQHLDQMLRRSVRLCCYLTRNHLCPVLGRARRTKVRALGRIRASCCRTCASGWGWGEAAKLAARCHFRPKQGGPSLKARGGESLDGLGDESRQIKTGGRVERVECLVA